MNTYFVKPTTRRTLQIALVGVAIVYSLLVIQSFYIGEWLPLYNWVTITLNLVLLSFVFYNMRNMFAAHLKFQDDGIAYRKGDQSKSTFVPRDAIRALAIDGLTLSLHTDEETHKIQLGTMKFAEVEALKETIKTYRLG